MTTLLHDLSERDAETLRAAWTTFGEHSQLDAVVEKAAGLIQAILKDQRDGKILSGRVDAEIADLTICLQQVEIVMRERRMWEFVEIEHAKKMYRLKARIRDRTTFYDEDQND